MTVAEDPPPDTPPPDALEPGTPPADAPPREALPADTTPPDTPGARRRPLAVAGWLLVVAVLAGTAVVVVLRATVVQELHAALLGAAGVSGLLLGGLAVLGGLGAVLTRRSGRPVWARALAVVLPLAALVQATWPSLVGLVAPEDATAGRPLTVVAQNLWRQNPDPAAAARTVLATDADVLVLTEVTLANLAALRRAGAFERYPFRVLRRRDDTQGMAVLSRVPLTPAARQPRLFRLVARLEPPGARPLVLVAVHLPAPNRPGAVPFWRDELAAVARDARAARGAVVVAGDANAAPGHVRFRRMAATGGLRSAQDHGGGGVGATWPAAGRPVPPLMRLDHVLVGDDVGVSGFSFLPRVGADHVGVEARLRVPAA